MSDNYGRALGASNILLRIWRVLNLLVALAFSAALVASFPFEHVLRGYYLSRPPHDPDVIIPVLRIWVIAGLPIFFAIHVLVSRLLDMVGTVRAGDPFVPENAVRMKTIACCLLGLQLFDLACGIFAGILNKAGANIEWSPSLSGWVAVALLFVLARVFEEGARIRADLEAMV
ncbi:MAG TPA: DUF2975 domain-containing protein [Allosphingosinicella sp.]|nr:DUF2975 domain-containing protein [Allosphingosinicella sp.]